MKTAQLAEYTPYHLEGMSLSFGTMDSTKGTPWMVEWYCGVSHSSFSLCHSLLPSMYTEFFK